MKLYRLIIGQVIAFLICLSPAVVKANACSTTPLSPEQEKMNCVRNCVPLYSKTSVHIASTLCDAQCNISIAKSNADQAVIRMSNRESENSENDKSPVEINESEWLDQMENLACLPSESKKDWPSCKTLVTACRLHLKTELRNLINHFCEFCDETDQGWACRGSYFTERYNQFTANLVQSQAPELQKIRAQIKAECGSSTIQRQQWLDAVSEVTCALPNPMKNPAPKCEQLIQDCTSLLGQQFDAFMDAQGASCKKSEGGWTCGGQNFFKAFGELTNNYIYNQDRDPEALEGTFKTFRKMQDEVVAGCQASMKQIMRDIQDNLSSDLNHKLPLKLSPNKGSN